ncbi:hypothetical protein [Streptomyces sp. XD-27]|uniref:hypothetical protein n=1 Tax=Streptomyces sp. XD-27 TaxID=3062779 RepID=UPI0026F465E7|nr:hypothetical protein [Streptomyces sp. XD-27]WKX72406.1 hypothetical protein Q3Y56_23110 [Streptomyces sp. XD-27]
MNEDSSELDYEPKSRSSREVEEEVGSLSSRLLDMTQIKGKVTDLAPMASSCGVSDRDADMYRSVRHPWSIYGVENSVLQKGMEKLVDRLPKEGWRIVKNGPDASKNRNQEILAVHLKTRIQTQVTWKKGLDGRQPLIAFAVYSRCFRDPGHSY